MTKNIEKFVNSDKYSQAIESAKNDLAKQQKEFKNSFEKWYKNLIARHPELNNFDIKMTMIDGINDYSDNPFNIHNQKTIIKNFGGSDFEATKGKMIPALKNKFNKFSSSAKKYHTLQRLKHTIADPDSKLSHDELHKTISKHYINFEKYFKGHELQKDFKQVYEQTYIAVLLKAAVGKWKEDIKNSNNSDLNSSVEKLDSIFKNNTFDNPGKLIKDFKEEFMSNARPLAISDKEEKSNKFIETIQKALNYVFNLKLGKELDDDINDLLKLESQISKEQEKLSMR